MVTNDLTREKLVLLAAMQDAGKVVLELQRSSIEIKNKANNDIVTEADLRANEILKNALLGTFPNDGWLSEETVDDADRLTHHRVWIVDPIDGTREYAARIPEYAISVALVENGVPILAAVFNPATNELFHAVKDGGAWLGDSRLSCLLPQTATMQLLASRSEYKRGEWAKFEQTCSVTQVGSIAYKLALLAAGRAHATFSLGPKSEWDIAAGVLLVLEAGGEVTDKDRQPFVFNNKNIRVNGVVATAAQLSDKIFALISHP